MRPWAASLMVLLYAICFSKSGTASLTRKSGNNTIVALLPVHIASASKQCSKELDFIAAVKSQALIYAVEKVNSDASDISLGFDIEDICSDRPEGLLDVINTLFKGYKNEQPTAFLVDLSDLLNGLVVHKSKNVPVFSLGSHSSEDDIFYLEPSKPRLSNALVKLVQELNLTVFDAFVANSSSDYEIFSKATKTSKVCQNRLFYEEYISSQTNDTGDDLYPLVVFSDSLKTLTNLPSKFKGRDIIIASDFLDIDERFTFPKTLAVTQRAESLEEFEEFLMKSAERNDSWFGGLLRGSAQFKDCSVPGNESCLSEILGKLSIEVRHGVKVIDAVYSIAHALKSTQSRPLSNEDIISTPEFTSPTGRQICFSQNKDLSKIDYSVYNLARKPAIKVGKIQTFALEADTVAELSLDELQLNRDAADCLATCPDGLTPVPTSEKFAKCCVTCQKPNSTACEKGLRLSKDGVSCVKVRVDYLRWKHPLSIIIFIIVILLFCGLLFLVNFYNKKAQTPVILTSKLATMPLLLSLFVTLIHPLLPIIKPSSSSCNAYVFGFVQALGIPLCILISRSNSYFKRFRSEDGSLKKKVCRTNPQNLIAIFLILIQITLSIIFIAVSSAHVVYYETADPHVDYIECSTFGGGEFLFPFFYTIILSLFFTVKNFGAATQEEDTYESHFTAIFFFGFYFLSFVNIVVVYGILGKVKVMVLCVLGVLHVLNFLCFLFFPKIYVVVFSRDPTRFSPFPLASDREVLIFEMSDDKIEMREGPP